MRQTFFSLASLRRFLFQNAGEAYLYEGVTATSIVVLSFILLFYICYLKRAADDATRFFQSCPVSKALSFLVAGVTYLYEGVTATSIVVLSFYSFVFTFVVL